MEVLNDENQLIRVINISENRLYLFNPKSGKTDVFYLKTALFLTERGTSTRVNLIWVSSQNQILSNAEMQDKCLGMLEANLDKLMFFNSVNDRIESLYLNSGQFENAIDIIFKYSTQNMQSIMFDDATANSRYFLHFV